MLSRTCISVQTTQLTSQRKYSSSIDKNQLKKDVMKFYRETMRGVPLIIQYYQLPYSVDYVRKRIRHNFEEFRDVKDVAIVSSLLTHGIQDFQEAIELWKTKAHVMQWFEEDWSEHKPEQTEEEKFLEDFLGDELLEDYEKFRD
eukprot:TRINITY_DN12196_c0_g1_i1.p1 TRINITY_DN12196_c0_g1~~TRINITY_DN12196_c0_g1_i1.p1  ORF type:complete len:144 (+),score=37.38 TRINITY_DN12196_c0_g1_i1:32-463(+)